MKCKHGLSSNIYEHIMRERDRRLHIQKNISTKSISRLWAIITIICQSGTTENLHLASIHSFSCLMGSLFLLFFLPLYISFLFYSSPIALVDVCHFIATIEQVLRERQHWRKKRTIFVAVLTIFGQDREICVNAVVWARFSLSYLVYYCWCSCKLLCNCIKVKFFEIELTRERERERKDEWEKKKINREKKNRECLIRQLFVANKKKSPNWFGLVVNV